MKKIVTVMAVFATLLGNSAFAQNNNQQGGASQGGTYTGSGMAWGIGLGALVIVGAVVGGTVAGATSSTSGGTFSH